MLGRAQLSRKLLILLFILICTIRSEARTWTLMPVGNSLTAGKIPETGVEGDGFRSFLNNKLGADFTFVGDDVTVTPGLNGFFQSGAKIEWFLTGGSKDITQALAAHNPEIVLLHIGTNNTGDTPGPYTEPYTSSNKLKELINTIGRHQSVGYILVSKIIPKLDMNNQPLPQILEFNEEIERMFFNNAISGKAVLVDLYSSVGYSELAVDGIHPTPSGYERMATEYARVIKAITNNPGDVSNPGAISVIDAQATDEPAISLEWWTPNDPGGIVNLYELRYLVDNEINSSNFNSGTVVTLRRPGKNSPSNGREKTKITDGILGGRTYNFAIRVYDQANNKSSISKFNPVVTPDELPEPGIAYVDSFDNAELRGWNADPSYEVSGGRLRNTDAGSGWGKLAILDSIKYTPTAEFAEVGARYASGNYMLGGLGLAMLLDTDDYRIANGYMVRVYGDIALYAIVNGQVSGDAISSTTPLVEPTYGDILSVVYRNNPTFNSFDVRVNGNSIGTVQDYNKRYGNSGTLYSGIILYGSLFNEVDNFSIQIPQLDPERMMAFGTPPIGGEVGKSLGSPISVKVLDINGVGVSNVPVDFNILAGVDATLSADDVCGSFGGDYYIEAELGILESPMGKAKDNNASNGSYIATKSFGEGIAKYNFWICDGSYDLIFRAYAPNSSSNSIYYAIDDPSNLGDESTRLDFIDISNEWEWSNRTRRTGIYLNEGFHTLYLQGREEDTRIDKILLTSHSGFTPSGQGGSTPKFANVTDNKGIVSTDVTFGTQAGEVIIEATSDAVPPPENYIEFPVIRVNGGTPTSFVAESSTIIQGEAGRELGEPFRVHIQDVYGNDRQGEQVIYAVISGDGRFSGSQVAKANTDEYGIAEASLKLGYESETVIDVYLNNFPDIEHLTFKAVAEAGTIPFELVRLNAVNHFETNVNSTLPEPLQLQVLNQDGAPYAGYPVEFNIIAGDGKLNGTFTSVIDSTDQSGIAQVTWSIGKKAGVNAHVVRINATLNGAPMEFTTTAKPDTPYRLAKIAGDNQRQGAGKTFADSLTIQIQDQYDNGIPNYLTNFSVVPGNGDGNFEGRTGTTTSGASLTLQTDENGFAGVSYTAGTIKGENQIIAEGLEEPQLPFKNHTIFYLTVDPPLPQQIQFVSGNNQTQQVSKELEPFKVKIFDPFGKGIGAGVRVKFQVTKGTSQFDNSAIYETLTDENGIATAKMILGHSAGEQKVRVTLIDYPDVDSIEFVAVATPGPAAKLKRISPQQFSEKAAGLVALTVQVTDTYDNFKPGHVVIFAINSGGGVFKNPAGTTVTVTSDSEKGHATVTYQMGLKVSDMNEITATAQQVGGTALNGSPITFEGRVLPGAPTRMSKETSDYKRAPVATTIPEPYTVQIRDSNDNPVPSLNVSFTAKSKNALVDGLSAIEKMTNEDGRVSVLYTLGTTAKIDTLLVSAIGYELSDHFLITAEPGDPAKIVFNSDSLWQKTLSNSAITVSPQVNILDVYNNKVSEPHPVKFQIAQGNSSLLPGNVQEITQKTVNGVAQVTWQLGTIPQEHMLHATSTFNGVDLDFSPRIFRVSTIAGAPEKIRLVQPDSNYIYATANQPLLLKIQATDRWGNAIVKTPVNFAVELPESNKGVLIDNGGEESTEQTIESDEQGFAGIYFKPVITTTTVNRVRISVERGANLPAVKEWVHVFGETPTAKRMDILSKKQVTVSANGQVNVQVAAYDAISGGSLVPNHTVWFSVSKGDGHLQSSGSNTSTRTTNINGVAEEIWNVGPRVGKAVLLINGNTQIGSPDSIIANVQPAAPFADSSKMEILSKLMAGINGVVKLSLVDQFGNPVSGYELVLYSPNEAVTFVQPTSPTGADGFAYGEVMSEKAGPIRISAHLKSDETFRFPDIIVNVKHGIAARLELLQSNQFTGNIGAILKEPIKVRVTDTFGNIINENAAEVKFTLTNGSGSFIGENASKNNAFVRTDSLGLASIQLVMGAQANEAYLIEASLSDPNRPDVKRTFIGQSRQPVLPLQLLKVSGDSLTAHVGETLEEPFVARVVDKDGIAVWSENNPMVRFTPVIGTGEFPGGEFQKTDKYGMASAHYKFLTGGTHSIKAFIPTGNSEVHFIAFAQAGAPSKILPVENTVQEYPVKSTVSSIKVMLTDKDSNPVNDIPVVFTLAGEPQQENGATVDSEPVLTGSSGEPGIATAHLTLGERMGSYVVMATSPHLSAAEKVTFTINATPGDAYYLGVHSGDQQFGTKNRTLVFPIVAKVTDEYQNPVPDVTLDFWADAAQGHGNPMFSTVKTAENGLAENWWTIGDNEQCQLIVQRIGLRPSTKTLSAFAVTNNFPEFSNMPSDTAIFTKREFILPLIAKDKDNDPLTYRIVAGLPSDASFDGNTNILRWTPTQAGQWTIHYRVDDNKSAPERGFDVDSLKITVTTKIEIFSSYPQEGFFSIPYQEEQEFGVVATGTNIMYEWTLNDAVLPASNVSRYIIKASDYPRGALHSLKVIAFDAANPNNFDQRSWGIRTKVELTSFGGQSVPFKGVELNWQTSHEDGHIGFDVLRSVSRSGIYEKITGQLIKSTTGNYAFTDTSALAGRTYFYMLQDLDLGGKRSRSEAISVTVDVPKDFMLLQNYPNPFNPETTIRFQLPKAIKVKVVVYNINGRIVKTLADGRKNAGYYELHWSGQNNTGSRVSSGVYYVRLEAGDFKATKKMLLIK